MLTEITKTTDTNECLGWVFYDGECPWCIRLAACFDRTLRRRGFRLAPLQAPWARKLLGLRAGEPLQEMRLLDREGNDIGGADAMIFLAGCIWWAWPLYTLAHLPGMRVALRAGYRWISARRGCAAGACELRKSAAWPGWLGFAILPPPVLLMRDALPAWAFMWMLAGAIFAGCKWLTFWREKNRAGHIALGRAFGYLFAWPGMDATRFLRGNPAHETPAFHWLAGLAKTAFGLWLLFGVAHTITEPLTAGWIGMAGLIFTLHFGLFHLLALAWRAVGVDACPIMDAPIRATSPGEFWGRRWNGAFNRLAFDFVFRPMTRKTGPALATLAAFGVSGLIHELVISLPARGGYGLPTAYFLLQGLGVLARHTRIGRRAGLLRGARGWLFTMFLTAGPAFWLFHPPFVRRVILPFLQTIHAL